MADLERHIGSAHRSRAETNFTQSPDAKSAQQNPYKITAVETGNQAAKGHGQQHEDAATAQGAKIDSFGVGERLITSKSEPVFGGVYKLVAIYDENGKDSWKTEFVEESTFTSEKNMDDLIIFLTISKPLC